MKSERKKHFSFLLLFRLFVLGARCRISLTQGAGVKLLSRHCSFQKKLQEKKPLLFPLLVRLFFFFSLSFKNKKKKTQNLRLADGERGVEGLLLARVPQGLARLEEHRGNRAGEDRERELGGDLFFVFDLEREERK